jgi:AraC family transcriptional regulator
VLSSDSAPWRGIRVEQYDDASLELTDEAPINHIVVVQLDRPPDRRARRAGRVGRGKRPGSGPAPAGPVDPGQVSFFPALTPVTVEVPATARHRGARGFLCLSLEPTLVLCAAHDLVQRDRLELIPRHAVDDPFVRGTALALRSEIQAGYPGGRTYGELLASALAVHLVRNYSARPTAAGQGAAGWKRNGGGNGNGNGGLNPGQLRRAIEWINEHLPEDRPIERIADEVGLSAFHFARLFKCSTGHPPHQYRIQRRVERAKELLVSSDATIAEIAVQVGFCDQSHFASHFKRMYGVTPKAFLRRFAPHGRAGGGGRG